MKNSKKVLSLTLAATMLGSATTAFAMPADTVVIGDKAYEMAALDNMSAELQAEITAAILGADSIYYNISGITEGFLNADGGVAMTTEAQTALKNVVLTKADGTKETFANFEDETGTVIDQADLTAYNAAMAAVTEADYTVATWTAYQVVVAANVVTMTNTQVEVDAATAAITAAQADLVMVAATGVQSVAVVNNTTVKVTFAEDVTAAMMATSNFTLSKGTLETATKTGDKEITLSVAGLTYEDTFTMTVVSPAYTVDLAVPAINALYRIDIVTDATNDTIKSDGAATAMLTAKLIEIATGNAVVEDAQIQFTTTLGSLSQPQVALIAGEASTQLRSTSSATSLTAVLHATVASAPGAQQYVGLTGDRKSVV